MIDSLLRDGRAAVAALYAMPESASALGDVDALAEALVRAAATTWGARALVEACPTTSALTDHALRVAVLAVAAAQQLGLAEAYQIKIARGALLHDLGQMLLPDEIRHGCGDRTPAEAAAFGSHPEVGLGLLMTHGPIDPVVYAAVRSHHERLCGGGSPFALTGAAIELSARLVGAADALDATAWWTDIDAALDALRADPGLDETVVGALAAALADPRTDIATGARA